MTISYHFWCSEGLEAPQALRQAQIWLRDLFHDEHKAAVLGSLAHRMSAAEAQRIFRAVQVRDFSHPYHWAAFSYIGW